MKVRVRSTDDERRNLFQVLNLREKLRTSQAYLTVRRESKRGPGRGLPDGTRSQLVEIRLSVNHYLIRIAHRYITPEGRGYTQPDPKRINIDDLALIQE